jgi:predicted ester cyclase
MKRRTLTLAALGAVLIAGGLTLPAASARHRSSTEANKTLVRQSLEEMFNQGNVAAVDKYVAADYVEHQTMPGIPPGREGLKQVITTLRQAFPDMHITIDDVIAEGDKVVVRSSLQGTQKGAFMGIAPTGKTVTMTGIDILRLQNGIAVEHWGNEDDLGMMQQLGAIPPPPAAAH